MRRGCHWTLLKIRMLDEKNTRAGNDQFESGRKAFRMRQDVHRTRFRDMLSDQWDYDFVMANTIVD